MCKNKLSNPLAVLIAAVVLHTPANAQVSERTLEAITTPDRVETSIGTLRFLDGAPYPETAEAAYDYLDTMRGVDAFLKGIRAASVNEIIRGLYSIGAEEAHQVVLFDELLDPQSLFLTANSSTMYIFPTLDLERDGPTVVEAPPQDLIDRQAC